MTTYNLVLIVLLISIIVWAMPMFRQANSRLFFYFYILALSDPLTFLFGYFRLANPNEIIALISIINFFALKNIVVNKKVFYISTALLTLLYIFLLYSPTSYMKFSVMVTRIFVLIVFLMYTLRFVATTSRLNIFYIMLLFYEVTVIAKIYVVINYSESALIYYVVTSLFQVLIAIWFTIFKEDNPKLHLNLSNI